MELERNAFDEKRSIGLAFNKFQKSVRQFSRFDAVEMKRKQRRRRLLIHYLNTDVFAVSSNSDYLVRRSSHSSLLKSVGADDRAARNQAGWNRAS